MEENDTAPTPRKDNHQQSQSMTGSGADISKGLINEGLANERMANMVAPVSSRRARSSGRPSPLCDEEISNPNFSPPEEKRLTPGSIVWTEFHYVSNDKESARKLRPAVVIGEITVAGRRHLMLAPVSRKPPVEIEGIPDRGIEIPDSMKSNAGFRQDRIWVNVSEANCLALPTRRIYPVMNPDGDMKWSGGELPKEFVRDSLWRQMMRHDGEESIKACGKKTLQIRIFPPEATPNRGIDFLSPEPEMRGSDAKKTRSRTLDDRADMRRMTPRRNTGWER